MPKLEFKIATKLEEAKRIYAFKEAFKSSFALRKGSHLYILMPSLLKKKIINSNSFLDVKRELVSYLRKNPKKTKINLDEIKEAWKDVSGTFFREVTRLTNRKFDHSKYKCFLIFSLCGHYKEGTNKIYVESHLSPKAISAICSEELLHLHYWKIIKDLFKKRRNELTDKFYMKPWQISEVIPEYVLIDNKAFKEFGWNKWDRSRGYPWIPKIRKTLDPIWKKRKSFDEFVINAHKRLKCLP